MHYNPVIGFVDEVRAAADIVQVGRVACIQLSLRRSTAVGIDCVFELWRSSRKADRAFPVPHLAGMCHKPHVHIVMLCEALECREHLAHVLGFIHIRRSLVVQLVVRVNNKSPNTEPVKLSTPRC